MAPKVSVITPTYARDAFLPGLVECFAGQTYANLELLILDDSPQPSRHAFTDPRMRYIHVPERLSIGEKRNRLIAASSGEVIVHFDDDDYYAPGYVEWMVRQLGEHDLVKLVGWFAYATALNKYFYWQTDTTMELHYVVSPNAPLGGARGSDLIGNFVRDNAWGYGFSYVYRRDLGREVPFAAMNFGEDFQFFAACAAGNKKLALVNDTEGIVLHVLHRHNSAKIFPQYLLPPFVAGARFPGAAVERIAQL